MASNIQEMSHLHCIFCGMLKINHPDVLPTSHSHSPPSYHISYNHASSIDAVENVSTISTLTLSTITTFNI